MLVLQQLSVGSCSGYAIVKTIHAQTGWKPSYGSIYPLLERLQSDGLVTVKEEGRSKLYSFNAQGKHLFEAEKSRRKQALSGIVEQLRVLASMGDEEAAQMAEIIAAQVEGDENCKELPELAQMRGELHRLMKEGKFKTKTQQIRTIAKKAAAELKKL